MSSHLDGNYSWIVQIGIPCDARIFLLVEAESLLPVVLKVTNRAVGGLDPVCPLYLLDCDPRMLQLALEFEKIDCLWMTKMERFGLLGHSLWVVDFHKEYGFFSWKYLELRLAFFVDSKDPKLMRRSLSRVLTERMPSSA